MQLIDQVSQLFELHFSFPFNVNIPSDYVWSTGRAGGFGLGDDWQIRLREGYALDCADARKTLIVAKSRFHSSILRGLF
jgi:hypothetical protein